MVEPGFGVPGFEPGFGVPGLVEGLFGGLFGDVPGFAGDPGSVEPGARFGFVPVAGLLELLGFVVPAFGFVGFDPGGAVPGSAVLPVGGVPVLPVGGCALLPVGGCPVLPVGGAVCDACPGAVDPAGRAAPPVALPPAGAAWATTQVAQNRSAESNISFRDEMFPDDMVRPPTLNSLANPWPAGQYAGKGRPWI